MTEEPTEYIAPTLGRLNVTTELIAESSNEFYTLMVANAANAMIMAGGPPPDLAQFEELIEIAIAFTDKLIEKVRERSDV